MEEIFVTEEGVLCFDELTPSVIEKLQKTIPPDDVYLFLLLYMRTLEEVMQFLGENHSHIMFEMIEDYDNELVAAKHCSDTLDTIYDFKE